MSTPAPGDLLIAQDRSHTRTTYVVSIVPHPGQLRYETYEEAVRVAARWTSMNKVAVWLSVDGTSVVIPDLAVNESAAVPIRELEAIRELFEQLIRRIESEYDESPGLQLTSKQAERLWSLDSSTCAKVLDVLVERGALVVGSDKRYRRPSN